MIYTERKVKIKDNVATIDDPIVLYRGDRQVEVLFTITAHKFRFSGTQGNVINDTSASYGQLALALPDGTDLFSDIVETNNGTVTFTITGEMIDEIHEVGFYSFHIRLYNEDKSSRITLPPVMEGIEIREPIVIEADDNGVVAMVDIGEVDEAIIENDIDSFLDENGNLNIEWKTGDIISSVRLNQMVDYINDNTSTNVDLSGYATTEYVDNKLDGIEEVDLTGYATTEYVDNKIKGIEISGGVDLSGYATTEYVDDKVDNKVVSTDDTDFMTRHINLYANGTSNNLGINNSGTNYTVAGNYASGYVDIVSGEKIYCRRILKVVYYNGSTYVSLVQNSTNTDAITTITPPSTATRFRYQVSSSYLDVAFICSSADKIYKPEYGDKLPISYISDTEFVNKLIEYEDVMTVSPVNCDFFNTPISIHNTSVTANNVGINNSGTDYTLTGGYRSGNKTIGDNTYIYPYKIDKIRFKDSSGAVVKLVTSASKFTKLDIPTSAATFQYSVTSNNISTAALYMTDYELYENPPLPRVKNEHINMEYIKDEIYSNAQEYNSNIVCYGDSLTEGAGSTNAGVYSYPAILKTLINTKANIAVNVTNRGIGGNTSYGIAAKTGCYADMVAPFTIPADTTSIAITKNGMLGNVISGSATIRNGVNPVTISGIPGTLSYSSNVYYFARSTAGDEITISRPVQIIPYSAKADKGALLIICVGNNDGSSKDADLIIKRIRKMLEYLNSTQYIILGLMTTDRGDVNTALWNEFGVNYIDIYQYVLEYGLDDNDLTATDTDTDNIANNIIPAQLRSDDIHLNDKGYASMAKGVYLKGVDLGYWL